VRKLYLVDMSGHTSDRYRETETLAKAGTDGTRGSSSPCEKKRANSKAGSFPIIQCEPDKSQSEPSPKYKTALFLQQLIFPQNANLVRLSNKP
jgi:hypothetical protein